MTTWNRVQGDVDDTIVVKLNGITSLADVSAVEGHVWRGSDRHALTASVTDPDACTVTVSLGSTDGWLATATPYLWNVEVQCTFTDGTIRTWPDSTPDRINVRVQGDPAGED